MLDYMSYNIMNSDAAKEKSCKFSIKAIMMKKLLKN